MTSGPSHPRAFAPLALSHTALLTTFRRTGEAVSTPVSVALDDGRAYFMTAADSGKAKRLARDPTVTLAPCTVRGTVIGATVAGQAHPLEGEERRRARRLLRPMAPLWGTYLLYRLRGKTMRLYEVTPARTPTPQTFVQFKADQARSCAHKRRNSGDRDGGRHPLFRGPIKGLAAC